MEDKCKPKADGEPRKLDNTNGSGNYSDAKTLILFFVSTASTWLITFAVVVGIRTYSSVALISSDNVVFLPFALSLFAGLTCTHIVSRKRKRASKS